MVRSRQQTPRALAIERAFLEPRRGQDGRDPRESVPLNVRKEVDDVDRPRPERAPTHEVVEEPEAHEHQILRGNDHHHLTLVALGEEDVAGTVGRERHVRLAQKELLAYLDCGLWCRGFAPGPIPGTSPTRAQRNDPALMMFNGRLEHENLAVTPGERVRAYVVNVGPGVAAMHVMGTILETVYDGSAEVRNVQTYGIPAGSGAVIDFRIPEAGTYGLVDHDRLAYLPYGMVLTFEAREGRSPTGK